MPAKRTTAILLLPGVTKAVAECKSNSNNTQLILPATLGRLGTSPKFGFFVTCALGWLGTLRHGL
jgi:hypothetical protein